MMYRPPRWWTFRDAVRAGVAQVVIDVEGLNRGRPPYDVSVATEPKLDRKTVAALLRFTAATLDPPEVAK